MLSATDHSADTREIVCADHAVFAMGREIVYVEVSVQRKDVLALKRVCACHNHRNCDARFAVRELRVQFLVSQRKRDAVVV